MTCVTRRRAMIRDSVGVMNTRPTRLARSLRKRMTPHEVKLWVCLRRLRQHGFKFRRQTPIGRYIVDFACFSPKLVIEVDGGQHAQTGHAARDRLRDDWLISEGFQIHRVWNFEVDQQLDAVMDAIFAKLTAPE